LPRATGTCTLTMQPLPHQKTVGAICAERQAARFVGVRVEQSSYTSAPVN
jgi:hypothetical protein